MVSSLLTQTTYKNILSNMANEYELGQLCERLWDENEALKKENAELQQRNANGIPLGYKIITIEKSVKITARELIEPDANMIVTHNLRNLESALLVAVKECFDTVVSPDYEHDSNLYTLRVRVLVSEEQLKNADEKLSWENVADRND